MLIKLKVKTELHIIMLVLRSFEWLKQLSDIIHGEQRTAQDSHDFDDETTNLHVMLTAFSDSPQKVLTRRCCLIHLKYALFKLLFQHRAHRFAVVT